MYTGAWFYMLENFTHPIIYTLRWYANCICIYARQQSTSLTNLSHRHPFNRLISNNRDIWTHVQTFYGELNNC